MCWALFTYEEDGHDVCSQGTHGLLGKNSRCVARYGVSISDGGKHSFRGGGE